LMTQMLALNPDCRVLEIGTGSGYQTAVLAEIVCKVYTVEVRARLVEIAQRRLAQLGYSNIRFRHGDGSDGWVAKAPFDRIIVTACAPRIPPKLIEQMTIGGLMVLPVARDGDDQILCRVTRKEGMGMDIEEGLPVRFLPMTGGHSGEEGEY
jgi:protein-L-isoaspartate(D-aspartate) O-methyltransferase